MWPFRGGEGNLRSVRIVWTELIVMLATGFFKDFSKRRDIS
jgi:hypothetical protein